MAGGGPADGGDAARVQRAGIEIGMLREREDGSCRISTEFTDAMRAANRRGLGPLACIESAVDSLYPQLGGDERSMMINLVIAVIEEASPGLFRVIMDEIGRPGAGPGGSSAGGAGPDGGAPLVGGEDAAFVKRIALEAGLLWTGPGGGTGGLSDRFIDAMRSNGERGMTALGSLEAAVDSLYPQWSGEERMLVINFVISMLERGAPQLFHSIIAEIRDRPDLGPADTGTGRRVLGEARQQRGMR